MATISLYKDKLNGVGGLLDRIVKSVNNLDTQLDTLKDTLQGVNSSTCNLEDTVNSISSSSKSEKEKVEDLKKLNGQLTTFIETTTKRDNSARDEINKRKEDFYTQYKHLKPECEKSKIEKIVDSIKSAAEWCKEHWKLIVTIALVVVAVVVIVCTAGAALGPFATIAVGAAKGLLIGAAIGGVSGGLESMASGGSFLEGFENGAFAGAISGAFSGALGGAGALAGKCVKCKSLFGKTAKFINKASDVFDGMDTISYLDEKFGGGHIAALNDKLNSNKAFSFVKNGTSTMSMFTGGMETTMKCFVAGTLVLTPTGLVPIEQIKAGDIVISTDPDTMETAHKTVLETYIRETGRLVHLTINGETIITTCDHPFYVKGQGFVNAVDLCIGTELLDAEGRTLHVEDIYREVLDGETRTVYNFKVEDFHTYYVGESTVWVHNANDTYSKLRKVSPDAEAKDFVNAGNGKKVDPIYGYEVDRLEADHIMPLKEITEQPGFDQLSFEDQKAVANLKENFMGLGKSSNASKGAKPINEWSGHSKLGPIPEDVQKMLNERDKTAREAISREISERLRKK